VANVTACTVHTQVEGRSSRAGPPTGMPIQGEEPQRRTPCHNSSPHSSPCIQELLLSRMLRPRCSWHSNACTPNATAVARVGPVVPAASPSKPHACSFHWAWD
jgi:hypothetical protein